MPSSDSGATGTSVPRLAPGRAGGPGPAWSLRLMDGWVLHGPAGEAAVAMRERRLLALLAIRGARSRSRLAAVLWPDSDEVRAYGNLRAAVWHLQHHQHGVLAGEHDTLRLAPGLRVDVHGLEEAVATVDAAQVPAGSGELLDLLRALGCDELLPGWDEPWVEDARDLLHQQRLRALETLSGLLLERGDVGAALIAAMRAVAVDPLRESAHRALVRVHLSDGNNAEALRVYRAFRHRLCDELGVMVSPQLAALVHGVRVPGAHHRAS